MIEKNMMNTNNKKKEDIIYVKCPLCDYKISNNFFTRTFISPFNQQCYYLYKCSVCGMEFWEPLKIIPEFYENEVLHMYKFLHSGKSRLAVHHKPFFKYFPFNTGKLLDIGCGNGIFLAESQRAGFEVYGIDIDKKSVKTAKEKLKLRNIFNMSLADFVECAQKERLKFDIITFFEVLEHQDNPKEFLQNVSRLLKRTGYIAGSVPNKDRLFANLERMTNHVDLPPHHFLYFSKKSLKFLLEKEGFKDVQFHFSKRPIFNVCASLEEMFLGGISRALRNKIRASLLNNNASGNEYGSNSIVKAKKGLVYRHLVFNMLKMARNCVFFPFALFIMPLYNFNGYQIYFQARLK